MSETRHDWRVVVLAYVGGALGCLGMVLSLSGPVFALLGPLIGKQNNDQLDPLTVMLLSSGLALVSAILLAASYFSSQVLRGRPDASGTMNPMRARDALILLLAWLTSAILAQILVEHDPWKWAAPIFQLLAIGTPVYLFVRLGIGGVRGGSRLRLWGTLASGLVLGIGFAGVVELAVLLLAVCAGAVYLALHPAEVLTLQALVQQLGQVSGVQDALMVIKPVLIQPGTLLLVLTAVSGITPIIEELAKSSVPWIIYSRLSTPGHGFWCGVVSGAGFALFEGLMASADSSGSWISVLLLRAGGSMMHILAAAMAGWGIAAFRLSGKLRNVLGGYALALGIHALWNTSVVAIGYGALRSVLDGGQPDVVGVLAIAAGALVLVALLALWPIALIVINRQLRAGGPASANARVADDGDTASAPGLEG